MWNTVHHVPTTPLDIYISMRLLQLDENGDVRHAAHLDEPLPPYAILSHTWGADEDEVTYNDLRTGASESKKGYDKLKFCGIQALKDSLQYFWVDTCCIDKSSSTELSEAINSMYRYYKDSKKCYVYLSDVLTGRWDCNPPQDWKASFANSRWFTRGWTLQELIAPKSVEFFSNEGKHLGSKHTMAEEVSDITSVHVQALRGAALSQFSVEERMSWASKRNTKRAEDATYSILGLFDIHMSLIYGEGAKKARSRLEKEIQSAIDSTSETVANRLQ
ncbi:Nn.00g112460.m01.CDS01 [Neocucurbitaria sp. VM-36]